MRVAREVGRLVSKPEPCPQLSAAYKSYLDQPDDGDFDRVEALRDHLEDSEDVLTYDDLGSGMARGIQASSGGQVSRRVSQIMKSSAPPHQCRLIASLVSHFKPQYAIELGTCMGISAAYQGIALENNGSGVLYTIEGGAALAEQSRTNLQKLDIDCVEVINNSFSKALPDLLDKIPHVDFAFIDGHHDGNATLSYFEMLKPKLARHSVVVFDDLSWSPSMRKAWNRVTKDPGIACSSDLFALGICLTS